MQTPLAQVVGPVQPMPPHCPYNGAVPPVLVLVLDVVVGVVVVIKVVDVLPEPPVLPPV